MSFFKSAGFLRQLSFNPLSSFDLFCLDYPDIKLQLSNECTVIENDLVCKWAKILVKYDIPKYNLKGSENNQLQKKRKIDQVVKYTPAPSPPVDCEIISDKEAQNFRYKMNEYAFKLKEKETLLTQVYATHADKMIVKDNEVLALKAKITRLENANDKLEETLAKHKNEFHIYKINQRDVEMKLRYKIKYWEDCYNILLLKK